jgi:hypothetical protein
MSMPAPPKQALRLAQWIIAVESYIKYLLKSVRSFVHNDVNGTSFVTLKAPF